MFDSKQENSNISLEIKTNSFEFLTPLFSFDWFLIELGRKLLNKDDRDLINILVLSKSINQRATPLFRNMFLNFELQKKVEKFANAEKLGKILELFENHGESLNPNIFFNKNGSKDTNDTNLYPICVHDKQVFDASIMDKDCECAFWEDIPLVLLAMRRNLQKLFDLLLFHKRMNFKKISEEIATEILEWATSNNRFDVLTLILKHDQSQFKKSGSKKIPSEMKIFSFATSIVYDRFDFFQELLKNCEKESISIDENDCFDFVSLCSTFSKLSFFKEILKSDVFYVDSTSDFMTKSLNCGDDFIFEIAKHLCEKRVGNSLWDVSAQDFTQILDVVEKRANLDNGQLLMEISMLTGHFTTISSMLQKRNWSEQELFNLFRMGEVVIGLEFEEEKNYSFQKTFSLILNALNPETTLADEEIGTILRQCIEFKRITLFNFLWNHKQVEKTEKWAQQLLFYAVSKSEMNFVELLLKQSPPLDTPSKFIWKKELFVIENIDARICCWLWAIAGDLIDKQLEPIIKRFDIKLTPELFDLTMSVVVVSLPNWSLQWIFQHFRKSLWDLEKHLYPLLISACRNDKSHILQLILTRFSDVKQLPVQILSEFLTKRMNLTPKIFTEFLQKFQFKSMEEKQSLANLALKYRSDYHSRILALK